MPKSILVIDDDAALNALLKEYLSSFGYRVAASTDPDKGLKEMRLHPPDLVILDVMLPGRGGFEVCREIRAGSAVPIIMLTARGDVADRIVGLELGADDYLPKPFEPRELAARIQSVLRRRRPAEDIRRITLGDLSVDLDRRSAAADGRPIELTTMEFELLTLFARNSGIVLSRDRILESLRGLDWESFDRSIDVLVSRLRRKLGDDPKRPKYIRAVRGAGYQFMERDDDR